MRKTADDNKDWFDAETVKTVHRNFYIDDLLKSVKTAEDSKKLCEQLTLMLASGRFHLTKWIYNNHEVLDAILLSEMASQLRKLSLDIETLPIERALGLEWNVEGDCFQFNISQKDKPHTRRGILSSMVSSIFDPLGFVAPFVLSTKIIPQRLCKKGLGYDEIIPEEDLFEWQKWLAELPKLERIKVNQCFHPPEFGDITKSQLHHFSVVSELGYDALSCLSSVNSHGNINCSFVMGKSRLAPVKPRTIPRLKLSAATTAVRLDTMIKQELDVALDTSVFWTDSTSVLRDVSSEKKRF